MVESVLQHERLLDACSTGDIQAMESLLNEPKDVFDGDLFCDPPNEYPSRTTRLFIAAIESEQFEALDFLNKRYPKSSMYEGPVLAAMRTGNPKMLAAVCKIQPEVANSETGSDSCTNALAAACSMPNAAELIKVLLDAGADPNKEPPFRLPGAENVSAAVSEGLPVSTFEQLFDSGYNGRELYAVELAVKEKHPDILAVLFKRGAGLPYARFPPKQDLIRLAEDNKDTEMVALIQRAYPVAHGKKKGFFSALMSKFRS